MKLHLRMISLLSSSFFLSNVFSCIIYFAYFQDLESRVVSQEVKERAFVRREENISHRELVSLLTS